jgi:hypothetical protein
MSTEVQKALFSHADERFGKERAEQLRSDIELTADDIEKLRAIPLQVEDEP